MLAYYVEWHMRQKLAPLLFDDEDPADGERLAHFHRCPRQTFAECELKAQHSSNGRQPADPQLRHPTEGSGDSDQEPHSTEESVGPAFYKLTSPRPFSRKPSLSSA